MYLIVKFDKSHFKLKTREIYHNWQLHIITTSQSYGFIFAMHLTGVLKGENNFNYYQYTRYISEYKNSEILSELLT